MSKRLVCPEKVKKLRPRADAHVVGSVSPKRQWWHSLWFAILAILIAVALLALAVILVAWTIAPSVA